MTPFCKVSKTHGPCSISSAVTSARGRNLCEIRNSFAFVIKGPYADCDPTSSFSFLLIEFGRATIIAS